MNLAIGIATFGYTVDEQTVADALTVTIATDDELSVVVDSN